MAHVPKTPKELRKMGVTAEFAFTVQEWQKQNELGSIEMIALLQDYQNYLIHIIIDKCQKDDAEVDE
jgi:hypothetical protein